MKLEEPISLSNPASANAQRRVISRGSLDVSFVSRLVSVLKPILGLSGNSPGKVEKVTHLPTLPNWKTESVRAESFEKVDRIAMCGEGLEIHSYLDEGDFFSSIRTLTRCRFSVM